MVKEGLELQKRKNFGVSKNKDKNIITIIDYPHKFLKYI